MPEPSLFLQELEGSLESMRPKLASIQDSADWLISQNDDTVEGHDIVSEVIRSKVKETFEPVNDLTEKVIDKQDKLSITYARSLDFDELHKELSEQLSEIDTKAVALKALSAKPDVLQEQLYQVSSIEKELSQLDPLYKRIVSEGRKKANSIQNKEKDDIEDKIKELTSRKEGIDDLLKVRRSHIQTLQPVVKAIDETAKTIKPILERSEENLSLLRNVPRDEAKCEQQKLQIKVE